MNIANSKLIQYIWKVMPAFKYISILINTLEEMSGFSWRVEQEKLSSVQDLSRRDCMVALPE